VIWTIPYGMVELDMDPSTLVLAVKAARDIFKGVKESIDLIPDPVQKAKALAELALLQQKLTANDVEIAKSIGYELCLAHVPIPGIMRDDGDVWRCTVEGCNRTRLTAEGQAKQSDCLWRESQRQNEGFRNDTFI
jgi:hypothetical protein